MKIECINKNLYKIYINKYYYHFKKETINECITKILLILKKIYNIEVYSEFVIKCYINNIYGIILEIERKYDPFSLYTKKTNLEIYYYNDSCFLYDIEDYFIKNTLKNYNLYIYKNKYYIELIDEDDLKLIEFTNKILYGDEINKIINKNA